MPALPERVFYSLNDIQNAWQVRFSDLKQWLIHDQLKAHTWLPMMSVYELKEEPLGSQVFLRKQLRHWEGYTPLDPHHYRRLFKTEKVYLREFSGVTGNARLLLTETQDSIAIDLDDLVILNEERKRFEKQHQIHPATPCQDQIKGSSVKSEAKTQSTRFDPDFRKVTYRGHDYSFGEIQAEVVRLLYEASLEGNPWQNGKRLLANAGSQSFTIANIFKSKTHWRKLILSDGRGFYRLEEDFLSSLETD